MTDYALSRLSSRSFEHLVQALTVRIMGPAAVIFGDGPDGGREAIFEREVPYPSETNPWDGYGVVQAKFLQRPSRTPRDGDWAVDQLNDELRKYVEPNKNVRQPDYFVYVTNAVLTPVNERGSKDRARALLEDFKAKTSLRDYAIWDYDQICAFLDAYEDVRTAYAPLITPGDVLAAIIKEFQPDLHDLEETLVGFLQKELLSDEFVNLEQAGHELGEGIPLAKVFVDLPTVNERDIGQALTYEQSDDFIYDDDLENSAENGFIQQILTAASARLSTGASGAAGAVQSLDSAISRNVQGRFVLIGGPGQGKTTLGQFICQIFRASIVSKRPLQTLSRETQTALSIIQEHCVSEGINDEVAPRFPFRLSLSDFASTLFSSHDSEVSSVFSYLARQIRRRTDRNVKPDDLRRFLAKYPSIIIFDGLDEVPASSNRNQVLGAIRDFWVDASRLDADILCIATSRPQGYNEEFSPLNYEHCRLAELSPQLGRHFAKRLVDVRYGTDADRKERVLERLERAFENESTSRLMRSPLQLTIMTALVDRRGQPPQARWSLFKSYYEVIYQREEEKDIPASSILRDYSPDINTLHHEVGLLLQIDSERTGATDARLPRERFRDLVEVRLAEEGHEGDSLTELAQQIVDAAAERLVFLVELEEGQIGFEIRSLQEFMAAQSLMEGSDQDILGRLEEIAPIQFWRNVFLFAAGQCFSERRNLRDTIYSICAGLNELESDEISAASLAGSDLAVALLDEGLARRQPRYARMIARVAVRCLDVANPNLQTRFARAYDPQLKELYRDEISRRIISSTSIGFVGAWNCLLRLVQDRIPWAVQLAAARWPKEQEPQIQIIGGAQEPMNNPWALEKIVKLLPVAPLETLRANIGLVSTHPRHEGRKIGPVNEAALEVIRSYHPLSQINVLGSTVGYGNVVPINGPISERIKHLRDIVDWHSSWAVYKFAAEFTDNPSKAGLASTLSRLAGSCVFNLERRSRSDFLMLPWPILACLNACSSSSELLAMAAKAQSGELGDVGDWETAENRWKANGVTKEDLLSMTEDRLPYDRAISYVGFPTTLHVTPVFISPPRANEPVEELLEVFHSVSNRATKRLAATVINWSLVAASFYRQPESTIDLPAIDIDTLKSIYHLVPPNSLIPADILIEMLDALDHDILDVLVDLPTVDLRFAFNEPRGTGSTEIAGLLYKSYVRNRGNVCLLPILAGAVEGGVFLGPHIKVPKPDQVETTEHKSAALLINLAQESWETDAVDDWIRITQDVAKLNRGIYQRIASTFALSKPDRPSWSKYLAALTRQIPLDDFQSNQAHVRLLSTTVALELGSIGP